MNVFLRACMCDCLPVCLLVWTCCRCEHVPVCICASHVCGGLCALCTYVCMYAHVCLCVSGKSQELCAGLVEAIVCTSGLGLGKGQGCQS